MTQTEAETDWIAPLVQSLGELGPIPEGLTIQNRIKDKTHGALKIRSYATDAEARRIAALLQDAAGKIAYPELLGRWRHHLVFRYLALEISEPADTEPDTEFQLGIFLGTLNNQPVVEPSVAELDAEFCGWLDRLQRLALLPGFTTEPLKERYHTSRPLTLPVRLGYWDAMPHNFGWHAGKFVMLDEKHLRPSFPGVGLVKPAFLLSPDKWQRVRFGYGSVASLTVYDRNRTFLEFYYLVAALYFYSLIHVAERVLCRKIPAF